LRVEPRQKTRRRARAVETNGEVAADDARISPERVEYERGRIGRRDGVRVQKPQHVAARKGRARVHLRAAPARGLNQVRAVLARDLARRVPAPAVHDDDLDAPAVAEARQGLKRRAERMRLVERRDDDGDGRALRR
jgi:predicted NBD/HSP70 family sugar kinase